LAFLNHIYGKLLKIHGDSLIIDTGNFGFKIYVSKNLTSKLSEELNNKILLYIAEVIEKDGIKFFGFLSEEERDLFERLKNITGVGIKIALRIVSAMSPKEFYEVIEKEDLNALLMVPGVGKKITQKIFLEIKGVIPKREHKEEDIIKDTLLNLGYKKEEIEVVMKEIRKEFKDLDNLEEIIRFALRKLSQEI
jgi:Holliday junction DNA helicase RuvA